MDETADNWTKTEISQTTTDMPENVTVNSTEISCDDLNPLSYTLIELRVFSGVLILIGLTGFLGNIIVALVYGYKKNKVTSDYFVFCLALADLFACCVLIPLDLQTLWLRPLGYQPPDLEIKMYQFLTMLAESMSVFTLTNIAIDRYFCICWSTSHIMSPQLAIGLCCLALLMSLSAASPCLVGDYQLSGEDSKTVYRVIYFAVCSLALIVIIILYCKVYMKVHKQAQRQARQKAKLPIPPSATAAKDPALNMKSVPKSEHKYQPVHSEQPSDDIHTVFCGEAAAAAQQSQLIAPQGVSKSHSTVSIVNQPNGIPKEKKTKEKKAKTSMQAMQNKTAQMLVLVTAVFIVSFTSSSILNVMNYVDWSLFCYLEEGGPVAVLVKSINNMFYLNFCVNPIIYAVMNRRFRDQVREMIRKWRCMNPY